MPSQNILPINSLDFDEIKNNFKTYLKSKSEYKDFNFEASGISTLLNILSYNTSYMGYYINMLLNESFIDSAVKKESLFSKAKLTGYLPKGRESAKIEVILKVFLDKEQIPKSNLIILNRGSSFLSANAINDKRVFYCIQDITIYNFVPDIDNRYTAISDPFFIYEGAYKSWKFKVDNSIPNQKFVIQDKDIDINSLNVTSSMENSDNIVAYRKANNAFDIDSTSLVYFVSTNESGLYEVFFGNGIFGVSPPNQSIVTCEYIVSNGESGNGAKNFRLLIPAANQSVDYAIGNFEDFSVETANPGDVSTGGKESETIDSLRFSIPNHFKRQGVVVTGTDYKSILLSEYRNIESISVWGGEDHFEKEYGKVFISLKPRNADRLTESTKNDIKKNLLQRFNVVGVEPVFFDPDYIYVSIEVIARINLRRTSKSIGEIEKQIIDIIFNYNEMNLNSFDTDLSDIDLLSNVKKECPSIISIYDKKTLSKKVQVMYHSSTEYVTSFGNPILKGIRSNLFSYGVNICSFNDDGSGKLFIVSKETGSNLLNSYSGLVDYKTGDVSFFFPEFATALSDDNGVTGTLIFTATPENPDVSIIRNNIIRINKISVKVTEHV